MKANRLTRSLAATTMAVIALVSAGAAQANDVFWSIGLSSPGVQFGVSNAPPIFVQPPVYVEPYPVYVRPRPVYVAPSPIVYVRPAPIYFGPPQYIDRERPGQGWRRHGHRGGDGWDRGGRGRGHGR